MPYLKLTDLNLQNMVVLYRGPFNLPIDDSRGKAVDNYRATRALPSLEHILNQGGKLVLVSHLGRPKGQVVENLRMDPIGRTIEQLLRNQGHDIYVNKLNEAVGDDVEQAVRNMGPREVILLENTRFYPEEERCDPEFSRRLASIADVYIYDAPNDMHRRAASTYGVTHYLVSAAGFLMDEEITTLKSLLDPPESSLLILGGAKVVGKLETIEGLAEKYSRIILGGGMANTFLAATGFGVGSSNVETQYFERIKILLERYDDKILLPFDVVASDRTHTKIVDTSQNKGLEQNYQALDTGPNTNVRNMHAIANATGYILWNGSFGLFEDGFVDGTRSIAKAMSERYGHCITVILGGDTSSAVRTLNNFKYSVILTGGGSSLIFLENQGNVSSVPGLQGLEESYQRYIKGEYGNKSRELVR